MYDKKKKIQSKNFISSFDFGYMRKQQPIRAHGFDAEIFAKASKAHFLFTLYNFSRFACEGKTYRLPKANIAFCQYWQNISRIPEGCISRAF